MGTNVKSAARIMDASRRLVRALAGSARAIEARTGISGAQLFMLRQLAGAGQPLSVSELAELTLTHQSTVSGLVSRLVERGHVTRTPAADDARRVEVALTNSGRELLTDAPLTVQTQLVSGLARLGPARRDLLADVLEAWLVEAGLSEEPVLPFFERDIDESSQSRARRSRKPAGR
jgi:DNA-binding MarR family transcriptional regulator